MQLVRPIVWSLVAIAIGGCQATSEEGVDLDAVVGVDHIEMRDNMFDPPVVEVPVGTTVTWGFTDDGAPHNVVGEGFESAVMTDGTFTHTFMRPGTYDYTCTLHSAMDGRVVVTDA